MKRSNRSCGAAQKGLALAIGAWLSCGTSIFAGDAILPPASDPPAPATSQPQDASGPATGADTLASVWKQLVAAREEAAQLRREAEEKSRDWAQMREIKRQLAEAVAALSERTRQYESAQAVQVRLRQQVAELQERAAPIPSQQENSQLLQTEIRRLATALADAQTENKVLTQARNLMIERQVQNQLDQDAARRTLETRVNALEQEKGNLAKALAEAETKSRRELAARQEDWAAQEKAQADATIGELKKTLEAEQARSAALEKANQDVSAKTLDLEKALAKAKERTQRLEKEAEQLAARIAESEARPAQDESPAPAPSEEKAVQAPAAPDVEAEYRKELAELREAVKMKENALDDAAKTIRGLRTDAAEAEKQLPLRRAAVAARQEAEARAKALETEQVKMAKRTKRLEKKLADAEVRMQKLEEQAASQAGRADALEKEKAAQAKEMRNLRKELDKASAQIRKDGR